MSVSPTAALSRLSLDGPPPMTQHQKHAQPVTTSSLMSLSGPSDDESVWEDGEEEEDGDEGVISSATGLSYDISALSQRTQEVVRGLFNQESTHGLPQISLELCGMKEEDSPDSDRFYAFQMHELVPCSIRIGARNNKKYSIPRCECADARYRNLRPCKHLIWLFDRITKETLFDHDPESPLTLTEFGYSEELGDPFEQISRVRLDILAEDLHCGIFDSDSDTMSSDRARVTQAREIVATLAGVPPWDFDSYRPDLNASYGALSAIHPGDLEATLFSMILTSHSLAQWVRSGLEPFTPPVDPFRQIQQRVSKIISELDAYSSALRDPSLADSRHTHGKDIEGPRNVIWAATQIQHWVQRIEKLLSRGSNPLPEKARASAARSLVTILKSVANHNTESHPGPTADDRNLYMRLIGNHDTGFVYSALELLVDQSQFTEELEAIMDLLGRHGAPTSYVSNMRGLINRMRSHRSPIEGSSATTNTFTASGTGRSGVPRSDTPPMTDIPPPPPPPPPSAETEPEHSQPTPAETPTAGSSISPQQFLTPELPATRSSTTTRGGGGGGGERAATTAIAGSKRSGSLGGAQDSSPRGSKKRARGA
ncbi:hypothetical protein QBC35DRAFT_374968 [Podospora australis]|uniref:SWIM-type domain-containing protein n=1 Tax=Podospora australis TaxID=1536484 RepID=A0AAN6X1T5_9PEZI|nr:hypothetical protein QBC35DRAFT_374968 [Podospora australis]